MLISKPELLTKCLHGKTQHPNESLNKLIWTRCPKEVWVGVNTLKQATLAAVAHFNDGYISYVKIMQQMGINLGHFSNSICQKLDNARLYNSQRKSMDSAKQRRKTLRAIKKGYQDEKQEEDGTLYAKGSF